MASHKQIDLEGKEAQPDLGPETEEVITRSWRIRDTTGEFAIKIGESKVQALLDGDESAEPAAIKCLKVIIHRDPVSHEESIGIEPGDFDEALEWAKVKLEDYDFLKGLLETKEAK
jgi:hypothetical protein